MFFKGNNLRVLTSMLLLWSPVSVVAGVSINVDMTAQMQSDSAWKKHKKSGLLCGRLSGESSNGQYGPHHPKVAIDFSQVGKGKQSKSYKISLDPPSGEQDPKYQVSRYWRTIRKLSLNTDISEQGATTKLALQLSENRPFDPNGGRSPDGYDTRCTNYDISMAFSNPSLSGKVVVSYAVPEKTHLVLVRRLSGTGIFNSKFSEIDGQRGMQGSLNRNMDKATLEDTYFLWVKPGSTLEQVFNYETGFSDDFSGELAIEFSPVHGVLEEDPATALTSLETQAEAIIRGKQLDESLGQSTDFASAVAKFVGEPQNLKRISAEMNLAVLQRAAQRFRTVRDSSLTGPTAQQDKLAATILTHLLARNIIEGLLPMCEATEIELPYQNTKIQTNWVLAASYLLNRTRIRLLNYTLADSAAMLSHLEKFQKQGRTFAQVRDNEIDYAEVLDSYRKMRISLDLRSQPLAKSFEEVAYLIQEVKSLGVGDEKQEALLAALNQAQELERGFGGDVMRLFRSFQSDNHAPVDVTVLKERAEEINFRVSDVLDQLDSGQQMLFALSSGGLDRLTKTIVDFTANDIEVFALEMRGELEYFRTQFFNFDQIKAVSEQAKSCWAGR